MPIYRSGEFIPVHSEVVIICFSLVLASCLFSRFISLISNMSGIGALESQRLMETIMQMHISISAHH